MFSGRSIKIFIFIIILATGIRVLVLDTFSVKGDSMYPAIKDGDYVVVNRLSYLFNTPNRGDIIVVHPRGSSSKMVKRIIGLPKERVVFDGDRIIIKENRADIGTILFEEYVKGDKTKDNKETFYETIDPNEYYVLGDNRDVSIDSRRLGGVDKWSIKGRVIFTIHI